MTNRLRAGSAVAVLVACCSAGAQQADRAQTEALSRRAADRLGSLHDEADRLARDERTLLGDLRRLEIEREIQAEELRQLAHETGQVEEDLSALDAQVAALEEQTRADAPDLAARLVNLYKLGQGRYVRLLLSASDLRQLGRASRMVAALADRDRNRAALHQRRLDQLGQSRATLEARRSRVSALRQEAERANAALAAAVAARNARIRDIDDRRDLNAQFSGELLAAQQKLQATLSGLAANAPPAGSPSLPMGPFRGDLEWPVAGGVRRAFGRPVAGRAGASSGIDIAAAEGTPVQAVHEGTVVFAGAFTGFGNLVIVDHGARTFSLYGNLADVAAATGTPLARGDAVGSVGVSATGAAGLYFELRVDGGPVDPLQWLRKR